MPEHPKNAPPTDFKTFWAESIALRERAGDGDLDAMRELAARGDPIYLSAFREACIEVLGEDPDDWR